MNRVGAIPNRLILGLLIAAATAMSSYLAFANPNFGGDAMGYLLPIHNLVAGQGYTLRGEPQILMPPGYGLLSYPVYLMVQNIEMAGMVVSIFGYLGTVLVAFLIGRRLFGELTGLLSAAFVVFCPVLLAYSYVTLSDSIFVFVYFLGFYFFLSVLADEPDSARLLHLGKYLALGVILGLASLIRPEAYLPSLLAFGWLLVVAVVRRQRTELLLVIGAFLLFSVVNLPYFFFIHEQTGKWLFSTKVGYNLVIGEKVTKGSEYVDRYLAAHPNFIVESLEINLFDYVQRDVPEFVQRLRTNLKQVVWELSRLLWHALVPLALIWLIFPVFGRAPLRIRPKQSSKRLTIAFVLFLLPLAGILPFFVGDRFVMPYGLLLVFPIAGLIVAAIGRMATPSHYGAAVAGVVLVSLLSLSPIVRPAVDRFDALISQMPTSILEVLQSRHAHAGLRSAGLWLKSNVPPSESQDLVVVAPRKASVALLYATDFDTNTPGFGFSIEPDQTLDGLACTMRREHADLLVLDDHYTMSLPDIVPLWSDPRLAEELYLAPIVLADSFQIYSVAENMPDCN